MNAVPFDTLRFARKLEASGMEAGTAGSTAEALVEATSGAELATKSDVAAVQTELANPRTELKADVKIQSRDLVIRLCGMMVIGFDVVPRAMRYLALHP